MFSCIFATPQAPLKAKDAIGIDTHRKNFLVLDNQFCCLPFALYGDKIFIIGIFFP